MLLLFPLHGLAEEGEPNPWNGPVNMVTGLDFGNVSSTPPTQDKEPVLTTPDDTLEEEKVEPAKPAEPAPTDPLPTSQEVSQDKAVEHGLSGILLAIPQLEWTTPGTIASQWSTLTRIKDPTHQLKAFYRSSLLHRACVGLIDFRQRTQATRYLKINFRDNYRGRSWAQPQLADTLILAAKRLRRKHKNVRMMVGDISQPGCGPLMYGELVRFIEDTHDASDATTLLNQALWHYGHPVALRTTTRRGKQITHQARILAHDFNNQGKLQLRISESRSIDLGFVKKRKKQKTLPRLGERLPKAVLADSRRVVHQGVSGRVRKLWRQHWVWPSRKRQMVSFSRRKIDTNTPLNE